MRVEVLLSCMNESDTSIVTRSNIQSDVLVINQCDRDAEERFTFTCRGGEYQARFIHTTQRGLSRSRNMAIKNAVGDVCLLCDDDERMEDGYVEKIRDAFEKYPDEQIIAFRINHPHKLFPDETYRVGFLQIGKIGSWQIAFRRCQEILATPFCEKMGSGSGNGGGEENRFLADCLKKRLKIRYVPTLIASVAQTESRWFKGYDKKYWIDRGWTARMIYGPFWGPVYALYCICWRNYKIDKQNPWYRTACWMFRGLSEKR